MSPFSPYDTIRKEELSAIAAGLVDDPVKWYTLTPEDQEELLRSRYTYLPSAWIIPTPPWDSKKQDGTSSN